MLKEFITTIFWVWKLRFWLSTV